MNQTYTFRSSILSWLIYSKIILCMLLFTEPLTSLHFAVERSGSYAEEAMSMGISLSTSKIVLLVVKLSNYPFDCWGQWPWFDFLEKPNYTDIWNLAGVNSRHYLHCRGGALVRVWLMEGLKSSTATWPQVGGGEMSTASMVLCGEVFLSLLLFSARTLMETRSRQITFSWALLSNSSAIYRSTSCWPSHAHYIMSPPVTLCLSALLLQRLSGSIWNGAFPLIDPPGLSSWWRRRQAYPARPSLSAW